MMWVLFGALALGSGLFIALPLRRGASVRSLGRSDSTMAILRDQLAEVDRDRARGLISKAEADAATIEVKRRMLALSRQSEKAPTEAGSGRGVLLVAAGLVPALAVVLYLVSGSPDVPSVAFADRADERAESAEIAELAGRLQDQLESDPEGGPTEGWQLLAAVYSRMNRPAAAAEVYGRLLDREDATSATFSLYAEALIQAENGIVTPDAEVALDRAQELDPSNPAATFYKSVAMEQAGARADARDLLLARLDASDGFQPWMESFVARANLLGDQIGADAISLADYAPMLRGPDAADMAAASEMSEEDRGAFIRSMVDGLATRLEENPDDLDGWLRLGRAYAVLGDTEKSRSAYESAEALLTDVPQDDPRRAVVRNALGGSSE